MNAVVIEHVPVAELPAKWRAKLTQAGSATVTVRIEEEAKAHGTTAGMIIAHDRTAWRCAIRHSRHITQHFSDLRGADATGSQ